MYALLVFAAVVVTFIIAIFVGGALVGLADLGLRALLALRAPGRSQEVKVEANLSKPAVRSTGLPEAARAETPVDAGAAYAPA